MLSSSGMKGDESSRRCPRGLCGSCPTGELCVFQGGTGDTEHSPALLWALAAQVPRLFQEDPAR